MNAAPGGTQGQASGLLTTAHTVGQSLSVALAGAMFTGLGGAAAGRALIGARMGAPTSRDVEALQQTFLTSFQWALMVSAAVAVLGVLAVMVRGDERRQLPASVPATVRHT